MFKFIAAMFIFAFTVQMFATPTLEQRNEECRILVHEIDTDSDMEEYWEYCTGELRSPYSILFG